jgi:protease II
VWLRNASEVASKFKCVQPMEQGVHYIVKHSGNFLYKISNELNKGDDYKVTRIALPQDLWAD